MTRKTVYIHIGYPKTGTTTLQEHFFPNLKGIKYIGKSKFEKHFQENNRLLFYITSFNKENLIENKSSLINPLINETNEYNRILISDESWLSFTKYLNKTNVEIRTLEEQIEKIKYIFNKELYDVHIIFTIRRQYDFIASYFAQIFTWLRRRNINTIKDYVSIHLNMNPLFDDYKVLQYDKIVEIFERSFGTNKVHLLCFEQLKHEPMGYYQRWSQILNTSIDSDQIKINAKSNVRKIEDGWEVNNYTMKYILSQLRGFLFKNRPKNKTILPKQISQLLDHITIKKNRIIIKIEQDEINKIKSFYKNSNMQLSAKYNLPLEEYEYW